MKQQSSSSRPVSSHNKTRCQYLRSLSKQYRSTCNPCQSKDEFIAVLQLELARLQALTNDLTLQLILHGSKPDPMIKAPQKDPNLKKCVRCNSSLLPLTQSKIKREFSATASQRVPMVEQNEIKANTSMVLMPSVGGSMLRKNIGPLRGAFKLSKR